MHDGRQAAVQAGVDRHQVVIRDGDVEDEFDRAAAGKLDVEIFRSAAITHPPALALVDGGDGFRDDGALDAAAGKIPRPVPALRNRHLGAQRARRGALDLHERDDRDAFAAAPAVDGEIHDIVVELVPRSGRHFHGALLFRLFQAGSHTSASVVTGGAAVWGTSL